MRAPCTNCGGERLKAQGGHGWCRACYLRWYKHGKPEAGPPPPVDPKAGFRDRHAEYAHLRQQGLDPLETAARIDIAKTTRLRYERLYRAAMKEAV